MRSINCGIVTLLLKIQKPEVFHVDIVSRPAEVYGQRTGRAIGQTLLDNPDATLATGLPNIVSGASVASSHQVGMKQLLQTAWEGKMTDTSLKYRCRVFWNELFGFCNWHSTVGGE